MKVPLPEKNIPGTDHSELGDGQGARLLNVYRDALGKIRKRPGRELFVNLGSTSKIDGLHWWDEKGILLVVSGGVIYKITTADGVFSALAGDPPASGIIASFASTGAYAFIANGGRIISYDNSANPAYIADADAPTTVTHIGYLDQYILANKTGQGQFYHSDVNAPLSWIATDYYSAEMSPDVVNALLVNSREVLIFGRTSVETWYNDPPGFSRLDAGCFNIGCLAPYSVVELGGTVFWLGNTSGGSREIYQLDGRTPRVITSIDLAPILNELSPAEEAYGIGFRWKDRAFYVISFTLAGRSFAYDLGNQEWYEWAGWNTEKAEYDIFPARGFTYARAWGLLLFGDPSTGKIFKMTPESFLDDLQPIRSIIDTGHISYGTRNKKNCNRIKITAAGNTQSGTTPVFSLSWNNDRKGFGNPLNLPLSKEGITTLRQRLGQYRTRQWRIEHSDNSDFILIDFEEDAQDLGR